MLLPALEAVYTKLELVVLNVLSVLVPPEILGKSVYKLWNLVPPLAVTPLFTV